MEINNITIYEYFCLEDTSEYDVFLDFVKPVNMLCNKRCNLNSISYNEFKVCLAIFNNPVIEDIKDLFCLLFDIRGDMNQSADEMFYGENVFTFFRAKKFIHNYLEHSLEREKKAFSGSVDVKLLEINAAELLSPFESLLTKMTLAEQFSKDPEEIGRWRYTKVFNILSANNAIKEVTRKYNATK